MSCERTDLQKSSPSDTLKITPREGECTVCLTSNYCCCVVEYVSGAGGNYSLCGTADGDAVSCSVDDQCGGTINGLSHTLFPLDGSMNPREVFCMVPGASFEIKRTTINGAVVQITCHHDQTSPTYTTVTFTGLGKFFYNVDQNCDLAPC